MRHLRRVFRSLAIRNFRLYFIGQTISMVGTWMQRVAQEWLVLELTGSGAWLGITAALQFLPMLVLAPWGGVLADRADKHRLVIITQVLSGLLALALGLLVSFEVVTLWMVCVLAFALGVVTALDHPARQSFVIEMVGEEDVHNAVTLNSVVVNSARAVGPAVAGVLIVTVGLATSFMLNALSFLAVIAAFMAMNLSELRRAVPTVKGPGQLMDGLRYVWGRPVLRDSLLLMAVAGTFAYEFTVTLPLLARYTFNGDAGTLGLMNSALGVGAVVGGLLAAGRRSPTQRTLVTRALLFGLLLTVTALSPSLPLALLALAITGGVSIQLLALGNALLQAHSRPDYRGRVMALWAVAFLGTTPVGAPLVGWISEITGPRGGVAAGGIATLLAAGAVAWAMSRRRGEPPLDH